MYHALCFNVQVWLPRVLQALLAAFTDVRLYTIIKNLENPEVAKLAVSYSTFVYINVYIYIYLHSVNSQSEIQLKKSHNQNSYAGKLEF